MTSLLLFFFTRHLEPLRRLCHDDILIVIMTFTNKSPLLSHCYSPTFRTNVGPSNVTLGAENLAE